MILAHPFQSAIILTLELATKSARFPFFEAIDNSGSMHSARLLFGFLEALY